MKVVRLPAIHHDGNMVLVSGSMASVVIDTGTSWYQALQVERLKGQLGERTLERVLLTSRRFPVSGAAKHLLEAFPGVKVHVHPEGQAALAAGDFFTTWANRYDSDMPSVATEPIEDGELIPLGDGEIHALALPGHSVDGMGYHMPTLKTAVVGALVPRADRPTRWDLPTGSLPDVVASLHRLRQLELDALVPLQGPAIRGRQHVVEVLDRHLSFFNEAVEREGTAPSAWPRPAATALWLTPPSPWPLEEREDVT
jgi:hydroxyacylglutathione hydrolase